MGIPRGGKEEHLKQLPYPYKKMINIRLRSESYSNLEIKGATTSPLVPKISKQHYRL
jgi:hypothetical protein